MSLEISIPFEKTDAEGLKCGDKVFISGKIYTARDAAHKRMIETLERGEELPFDIKNQIIYYAGPAPAKPGRIIGSCGPTTSCRMDAYAPRLIELGLTGMIGKGERDEAVIEAMKKHGAVYFGAIGGAGALIAECVKAVEVVAYEDLGTEAIRCLTVENFPAIVVIDAYGKSLYDR
ncbi:MAG: Fe-S-containing hydro-lyase [Clostridia bacterium]|nr:Fe-S-containing hydro-lyase [Clostridia bacterium]